MGNCLKGKGKLKQDLPQAGGYIKIMSKNPPQLYHLEYYSDKPIGEYLRKLDLKSDEVSLFRSEEQINDFSLTVSALGIGPNETLSLEVKEVLEDSLEEVAEEESSTKNISSIKAKHIPRECFEIARAGESLWKTNHVCSSNRHCLHVSDISVVTVNSIDVSLHERAPPGNKAFVIQLSRHSDSDPEDLQDTSAWKMPNVFGQLHGPFSMLK